MPRVCSYRRPLSSASFTVGPLLMATAPSLTRWALVLTEGHTCNCKDSSVRKTHESCRISEDNLGPKSLLATAHRCKARASCQDCGQLGPFPTSPRFAYGAGAPLTFLEFHHSSGSGGELFLWTSDTQHIKANCCEGSMYLAAPHELMNHETPKFRTAPLANGTLCPACRRSGSRRASAKPPSAKASACNGLRHHETAG